MILRLNQKIRQTNSPNKSTNGAASKTVSSALSMTIYEYLSPQVSTITKLTRTEDQQNLHDPQYKTEDEPTLATDHKTIRIGTHAICYSTQARIIKMQICEGDERRRREGEGTMWGDGGKKRCIQNPCLYMV